MNFRPCPAASSVHPRGMRTPPCPPGRFDLAERGGSVRRDDDPAQTTPRVGRHRARQAVTVLLVSALLLWAVIALIPGISASSDASVLLATLVVAAMSALLRPVLGAIAT